MDHRKQDPRRKQIWGMAAALAAVLVVSLGVSSMGSAAPQSAEAVTAQASYGQDSLTCSVDAGGYCTVTHPLGVRPTSVDVIAINGQTNIDPTVTTDTTYRPQFKRPNGSSFAAGTVVRFSAQFTYVPADEPTSPPPTSTTPTSPPVTTPPVSSPPVTTPPDPGTSPVLACTDPTWTTTSDDNNGDGRTVDGPGGPYFIHNNMWNNHSGAGPTGVYRMDLCDPYDNWKETWRQQPSTLSPGAVRAYPNIHKDYSDVPVSSIYAARFAHNTTKVTGHVWNVAFDSWITCGGNDFGGELMIWTENHNQTPAGTKLAGTKTIGGQTYEVWKSGGLTSQCGIFTYRSVATQTHGTMPLGEFYTDLKARGWISSTATSWQVDYGIETVSSAGADLVTNFNDFEIFDATNPGPFAASSAASRFAAEDNFEVDKPHPAQRFRDAQAYQKAKGWR